MKDKLKELKDLIDILLDPTEEELMELMDKEIEKSHKQEAKISIEKKADGSAYTILEGSITAILVTLAGLEKSILQKYGVPESVWEYIKDKTGTREVNDCE